MEEKTKRLIHQTYVESVRQSNDLIHIVRNLYNNLYNLEIPRNDQILFDYFLEGVRSSLKYRERTNEFTSLIIGLSTTLVYIIIFMNNKQKTSWDLNIQARRKSLERELTKILRQAIQHRTPNVRDRFGLRMILLNGDKLSEKELNSELYKISDAIQGILCNTNRKLRKEFLVFVNEIQNPLIKPQVQEILRLPFISDFHKDYLSSPKESGYKSLHFCLRVEMYADFFAGAELEIQIRSQKMHEEAEFGDWSHVEYEHKTNGDIRCLFSIPEEEFENLDIAGFTSYVPNVGDIDGIGSSKLVINRRVSKYLIPSYK